MTYNKYKNICKQRNKLKLYDTWTQPIKRKTGSDQAAPCHRLCLTYIYKAVPLQAWSGPKGSKKLRFPDFITTAQDGVKVGSPTHRPPLPPGNTPGTHLC